LNNYYNNNSNGLPNSAHTIRSSAATVAAAAAAIANTIETNHTNNQIQNTLSHPNATSSLLASLTAAISSTPTAHPSSYLSTSSHEHSSPQQHHPLGALPAAPLVPPTPGLINNHPTHNTMASAHSMGTTAANTTSNVPNSNAGSHLMSSHFPTGMPSDPTQRWRLLALRDVIRSNGDLTMLHLGSDLTNLGINLNLGE
jgi:hypothetical protein